MAIKGGLHHQILYIGDVKFGKLIDSLSSLFENAPENIILTGDFRFGSPDAEALSDGDGFTGYYDKVEVKKDTALKIFGDLKKMTTRAIENNGYLLHFGI
jgi:hypothetical protein